MVTGEMLAEIETIKAMVELPSPVSGTVAEVNEAVVNNPALVNSDPYGAGWFYKLKLSQPSEVGSLLDPGAYRSQLGE